MGENRDRRRGSESGLKRLCIPEPLLPVALTVPRGGAFCGRLEPILVGMITMPLPIWHLSKTPQKPNEIRNTEARPSRSYATLRRYVALQRHLLANEHVFLFHRLFNPFLMNLRLTHSLL